MIPTGALLALALTLGLASALPQDGPDVMGVSSDSGATGDNASSFELGVDAYRRGEYIEADLYWRECLALPLADEDLARVAYDLGNAAWRRCLPRACRVARRAEPGSKRPKRRNCRSSRSGVPRSRRRSTRNRARGRAQPAVSRWR